MLKKLRAELAAINMDDPAVIALIEDFGLEEVGPDDEVIGPLDNEIIRLNVLGLQLSSQVNRMTKEHHRMHEDGTAHDAETCRCFHKERRILTKRIGLLLNLFEDVMDLDYGPFAEGELATMRKGWIIVKTKPDQPRLVRVDLGDLLSGNEPSSLFDLLFGGTEPGGSDPRRDMPFALRHPRHG
ncbi:MAG: hypothetical protein WCV69_04175 [Patescibacteria group bacterium]|jgi:hypothetical protein